mmetsp:Transcript_19467/g.48647  ORF Transcript_19467/g.48647 Transcript_19467/m.48647 type:complete len:217 (-) Transcript_19467:2333-2983(-)
MDARTVWKDCCTSDGGGSGAPTGIERQSFSKSHTDSSRFSTQDGNSLVVMESATRDICAMSCGSSFSNETSTRAAAPPVGVPSSQSPCSPASICFSNGWSASLSFFGVESALPAAAVERHALPNVPAASAPIESVEILGVTIGNSTVWQSARMSALGSEVTESAPVIGADSEVEPADDSCLDSPATGVGVGRASGAQRGGGCRFLLFEFAMYVRRG